MIICILPSGIVAGLIHFELGRFSPSIHRLDCTWSAEDAGNETTISVDWNSNII